MPSPLAASGTDTDTGTVTVTVTDTDTATVTVTGGAEVIFFRPRGVLARGQVFGPMRLPMRERDPGQLDRSWDDLDFMHARSCSPHLGRVSAAIGY
ncbi:MAG: hypothetical protein HRF46_08670 [Acidobacteriota bacterium]|jgi:hypothetical protein